MSRSSFVKARALAGPSAICALAMLGRAANAQEAAPAGPSKSVPEASASGGGGVSVSAGVDASRTSAGTAAVASESGKAADASKAANAASAEEALKPASGQETQLAFIGGFQVFSPYGALGREGRATTGNALTNSGLLGVRLSYLPKPTWGVEIEGAAAPSSSRDGNVTAMVTTVTAQAILYPLGGGRVRPLATLGPVLEILASSNRDIVDRDLRPAGQAGVGSAFDLGGFWGLRLDGRVRVAQGEGRDVVLEPSLTLALYSRFPPPPPPEERLPSVPDRDQDGLADRKDQCPDKAGPLRNYGCVMEDADNDGIGDRIDECPKDAGTKGARGCPDADKDGVADAKDACPNQAGPKGSKGCGDPDGDGLAFGDKCPDQAETKNGFEDEDGCPDEKPAPPPPPPPPAKTLNAIADRLEFERGNNVLTGPSRELLTGLAKTLNEYPTARIEIVGHTDATGQRARNLALSRQRADAVRQQLIGLGVSGDRLTAIGRGPDEPVADNATEEGRAKNRRVELRVVK